MRSVVGRLIGLSILLVAAAPALAQDAARAMVPQLAAAQNPVPPPAAAPAAPAAPAVPAATAEEPPGRVGRVSQVSGNLAFHMHGETNWSAAGLNYPVATGGSFWTDPKSRAVLGIGPMTIDMAADTQLDIVTLNQQVAEFGLLKGEIRLHLRDLGTGESVAVDLAKGGLWMLAAGEYDIDAGSTGAPTRVAVLAGQARFVGDGVDVGIKTGEMALLTGANPVIAKIERATAGEFVAWCRSHDYVEQKLAAPYYVSPRMTGYAALDQYGSWSSVPELGEVWYPQVAADWVPYSQGRWVWIAPWGWNWVDAEPWGFAPFHYGRWAFIGGRWGWVPGGFVAHPVYAPALVAFVGGRFGVGWFPLGPGEMYWPGYTRNAAYIRAVNAAAVRDLDDAVRRGRREFATTRFANRGFAVAVSPRDFAGAATVRAAAVHVGAAELARAQVAPTPPHVRAPSATARAAAAARAAEAANRAPLPPLHAAAPAAAHTATSAGRAATPTSVHANRTSAGVARPRVQAFHAPSVRSYRAAVHPYHPTLHAYRPSAPVGRAPGFPGFRPPMQAFRPGQVVRPPFEAFRPPGPMMRPPAEAFRPGGPAMFRGGPPRMPGPPPGFGGGMPHPAALPHPIDGPPGGMPHAAPAPTPGGPPGDDRHR